MKKLVNDSKILILSAAILLVSAACEKTDNNRTEAVVSFTETAAETASFTAVTTVRVPPAVTEVTEDEHIKQEQLDKCRNIFSELSAGLSDAFRLYKGFGINCTDEDCIVCDPYSVDIYYRGPLNGIDPEGSYDNGIVCRLITDERFSSNESLMAYLSNFFTDQLIRQRSVTAPSFVKYEGSYFYFAPSYDLVFDGWKTENVQISDIVYDESFTAEVCQNNSDLTDRICFSCTSEGWRISGIECAQPEMSVISSN